MTRSETLAIPVNEAEAILDPFWDSALSGLDQWTVEPGGGCIFGSSNTMFPGLPLENCEYMLDVYREACAGSIAGFVRGPLSESP